MKITKTQLKRIIKEELGSSELFRERQPDPRQVGVDAMNTQDQMLWHLKGIANEISDFGLRSKVKKFGDGYALDITTRFIVEPAGDDTFNISVQPRMGENGGMMTGENLSLEELLNFIEREGTHGE